MGGGGGGLNGVPYRAEFAGNSDALFVVSPLRLDPRLPVHLVDHEGVRSLVDAGAAADARVLVDERGGRVSGLGVVAQGLPCGSVGQATRDESSTSARGVL